HRPRDNLGTPVDDSISVSSSRAQMRIRPRIGRCALSLPIMISRRMLSSLIALYFAALLTVCQRRVAISLCISALVLIAFITASVAFATISLLLSFYSPIMDKMGHPSGILRFGHLSFGLDRLLCFLHDADAVGEFVRVVSESLESASANENREGYSLGACKF